MEFTSYGNTTMSGYELCTYLCTLHVCVADLFFETFNECPKLQVLLRDPFVELLLCLVFSSFCCLMVVSFVLHACHLVINPVKIMESHLQKHQSINALVLIFKLLIPNFLSYPCPQLRISLPLRDLFVLITQV